MRKRSEVLTWTAYGLVVAWLAVALPFPGVPAALDVLREAAAGVLTVPAPADGVGQGAATTPDRTGRAWFQAARPRCNAVEVGDHLARHPAPEGMEGTGYAAACLALAGEIDEARARIRTLQGDERWMAAGIVFGPVHRIADRGDDLAAGPAMELVLEFWPNHHQALYHAGSARFQAGDHEEARRWLRRFVEEYRIEDAWTRDARRMLGEMGVS